MGPLLLQREPVAAGDVDADDRPRHCVEAGRVHDRVELERLVRGVDAGLGDRGDRVLAQVDQAHVGEVVGLVVVAVQAGPLGADVVVRRTQRLGDLGVVHRGADLAVDEGAQRVVRLGVGEYVVEHPRDAQQFAGLPHRFVVSRALLVGHHERTLRRRLVWHAGRRVTGLLAIGVRIGEERRQARFGDGAIACRDREVGGSLEHGELFGLRRDQRDRLHRRRSGADHGDTFAGEIDAVMGPRAGEVDLAGESVGALDVGNLRHRETSGRHDVVPARDVVAGVGVNHPAAGVVVPLGRGDPCVEPHVTTQVVLVGHELGVAEDLGLGGVPLGPGPLRLQLRIPAVGVVDRKNVAAGAGVAVPVPRAAHVVGGLEYDGAEACPPHADEFVHPRESCPHDHHVDVATSHAFSPSGQFRSSVSRPDAVRFNPDRSRPLDSRCGDRRDPPTIRVEDSMV